MNLVQARCFCGTIFPTTVDVLYSPGGGRCLDCRMSLVQVKLTAWLKFTASLTNRVQAYVLNKYAEIDRLREMEPKAVSAVVEWAVRIGAGT